MRVAGTRMIGGEEHRPRKITRAVRVELEGVSDEIADRSDELAALELEIAHTGNRLDALGEGDGKFDAAARDKLLAERRELRKRIRALNSQILDLQSMAIGIRLDPPRPPEWIDEHVEPAEAMEILEWLSERPTGPSANESEPS